MTREFTLLRLGALVRFVSKRLFKFDPLAITIGFTRIYWITPTEATRRHELEHVRQAQAMGRFRFWLAYFKELYRHGYWLNKYEVEARKAEISH